MKLPLTHKSKHYIPFGPTISLNSTQNKTNYDSNFISIKKKILSINTNNIDFPYENNNIYPNQINFHFIKNNTHNNNSNNTNNESHFPKQELIFTQSLGDLRKINNMANSFYNKGNNTSLSIPRFKKTIPKILYTEPYRNKIFLSKIKHNNISNTANQSNININYNIKSTSHDKRLLDNKFNNIKRGVDNNNISKNNIKYNKSNGTLLKQIPPHHKLQMKLNSLNNKDNNIKCIYTNSNNPQTQLIKDNIRDTKRLLPLIKSSTSSSNNLLNFFTEKVIQDFICKSIPKPFNDDHTFPSTTFSVNQNILGLNNFTFFGIYKSIGKDGYHLSYIAKTKFEKIFSSLTTYYNLQLIQNNLIKYNETDIYLLLKDNNYNLIRNAFNEVNNEIYETKYNKSESGFSVFILLSIGNNIISASVGSLVKGLSVLYHNDNGKEIVSGCRLDGVSEDNDNSHMCFGFGNQNVVPFISEDDVSVKNVKCVFIANSALLKIIKQNSICRIVTKSILLGDKKKAFLQKEKISDTAKRIIKLYNELCNKSMCLQEEIVFVLIYI